jgi:hypothetical protein
VKLLHLPHKAAGVGGKLFSSQSVTIRFFHMAAVFWALRNVTFKVCNSCANCRLGKWLVISYLNEVTYENDGVCHSDRALLKINRCKLLR